MELIDKLTSSQVTIAETLINKLELIGKEPIARRTWAYIQKTQQEITNLWDTFEEQHQEIEALNQPNHNYFLRNYYDQAQSVKQKAMSKLEAYMCALSRPSESTTSKGNDPVLQKADNANNAETEKLVRLKRAHIRMESFQKQLQKLMANAEISNAGIELHSKNLTEDWRQLESLHEEILIFNDDEDLENVDLRFEILRSEYLDVLTKLQEKITSATRPTESDVRLPRLNIPIFEGKYENWTAFHDIFLRLIHDNKRLANVEKMHYLKTNLRGEAARLLNHLETSDSNYTVAWEIIKERYENKRKLFSVHIQAILTLPKLEMESTNGLKRIHDTMKESLHSIANLGIDTSSWAPIVIHLMIQKFDYETLKQYEQSHSSPREIPTFDNFYKFLTNRFQSLEAVGDTKSRGSVQTQSRQTERLKSFNVKNYITTTDAKCRYCHNAHSIYNCPEFLSLDVPQRNEAVKRNNLCRNCINHTTNEKCRSHRSCTICKNPHHTLLHQTINKIMEKPRNVHVQNTATRSDNEVLLATALIKATSRNGRQEVLRVLIDTGSQASCITEQAAQILLLPRTKTCVKLSGLGATEATTALAKVNVQIQPRFPSNFQMNLEALILPKLTKILPNTNLAVSIPWKNCMLADPTFNQPGPIDMIIGADVYTTLVLNKIRKSKSILAQNTEFGWVISGKVPNTHNSIKVVTVISRDQLDSQLKLFWEIEEATNDHIIKPDDEICEQHFQRTHVRDVDGRYTVQIPFKESMQPLGDSKRQALARLLQNEKKFRTNKNLEQEYKNFMAEYIHLKHMELVKQSDDPSEKVYYIPHHAVIKNDSTTTKLRVVFDASAKTTTGASLNDNMLAGPKLQPDLSHILLRWRKHRYVFTADIEKMYRQIRLAKIDQNYHRILWRFNPTEPVKEYRLTTVTYGTTSAPYLAIKTIQQVATDEKERYPQASKTITQDFYVDDVMSGANTLEEVQNLQTDLIQLLKSGGFKLRKWTSNHPQILRSIPDDLREKGILTINKDDTIKTLGIHWNPTSDTFHFKVNVNSNEKVTKRIMLSKIAQIFDPLGWITPVTLRAKIMIQELWKSGIAWDETPSPKLTSDWLSYQARLPKLEELKIQRWINYDMKSNEIEIHGFSDASERAYAAVIYCKIITSAGNSSVHLITAKSKVAPIKSKLTIPRLELCGAELLSKLMNQTIKALELQQRPSIYLWSDSMITIARIKGSLNKQKGFEANRILKILSVTNPTQWNYVKTDENPADCASRGINPDQISEHQLWWNGPSWLRLNKNSWPTTTPQITHEPTEASEKYAFVATKTLVADTSIFDRFSTLRRCIRVISYCKRFIDKCRGMNIPISRNLTAEEMIQAQKIIIKCMQENAFTEEIQMLQKEKPVPTKSTLLSLSPFLDEEKILRVGGRLNLSLLPYDERHPIILPQKSHLTNLVIKEAHLKTLHGGTQQTLAYIRRRYWILHSRNTVKKHINSCTVCFRIKARTCQQIMGNLPSPRVVPSLPFTHTGVDYAGPIQLKASKIARSKTYKGYIALFICLSTKAIHIEAVSDLTSEAFLAAFRRFTARRGHCKHLYSDCGTNFIGAQKILDVDLHQAIQRATEDTKDIIANDGTLWHFNPPAAPHMGGIWEAGVKSIKYHLKRIVGNTVLTYEELTTTLSQIEASLNSRPLCPLNDDPTDCSVLTPGHFLMGRAPISPPSVENGEKTTSHLTRWKMTNKLSEDFWNIWSHEYLSHLQQKPKWWKEKDNLKINELVLIKDEQMPSAKWRLGRIIAVHPGKDEKIRVVTLRCGNNTVLKRPVTKLCRLPIYDNPIEENAQNQEQQDDNNHITTVNVSPISTQKRKLPDTCSTPQQVKKRYIQEIEEAKRLHKSRSNGIRIQPVTGYNNLVPIEKQRLAKEKYEAMKSKIKQIKPASKQAKGNQPSVWNTAVTCLSLLSTISLAKGAYTITHPEPGLYIEDMGKVNLRRGTLRVELTLPLNANADIIKVKNVIQQMQDVCTASQRTSEEIHCEAFVHHLNTQGDYLLREIDVLSEKNLTRNKRGLLGKALTYVFGVNDEAYADISTLQQNQQMLQQTALHQSSIMLTTISHLNDTEARVTEKINSFTKKLNEALIEINTVQGWFTKINTNMINLHILTAYQIATNILDELERQYSRIITIVMRRGSIIEILPLNKMRSIIKDASGKLPSNLYITDIPEERINLKQNSTSITLFGYFNIVEVDQYTIMKTTPIPWRLKNNTYLIADVSNTILAINYNSQTYFEVPDNEIKNCLNRDNHQLSCLPTAISNIQDNTNCVVDEVYDRPFKHQCPIKTLQVPTILWKQLYMTNTWLFITTTPIAAGVVCNGTRQDIELNGTGVIQITKDCVIKTKRNTILPEIFDSTYVLSSLNKPLELDRAINSPELIKTPDSVSSEHILKPSDQLLGAIKEQQLLHNNLRSTTLQTIGHHTLSVTIAVLISVVIIILGTIFKRRSKKSKIQPSAHQHDFIIKTPSTPYISKNQKSFSAEGENV